MVVLSAELPSLNFLYSDLWCYAVISSVIWEKFSFLDQRRKGSQRDLTLWERVLLSTNESKTSPRWLWQKPSNRKAGWTLDTAMQLFLYNLEFRSFTNSTSSSICLIKFLHFSTPLPLEEGKNSNAFFLLADNHHPLKEFLFLLFYFKKRPVGRRRWVNNEWSAADAN